MRDAQQGMKAMLLESVNGMLHGQTLPTEWQGGVVKILTKREPTSMPENKLFTAVVTNRNYSQQWLQTDYHTPWSTEE